jgi:hypothetical protein
VIRRRLAAAAPAACGAVVAFLLVLGLALADAAEGAATPDGPVGADRARRGHPVG